MKRNLSRRIELLSLIGIAIISFVLYSPMVCHGADENPLDVEFSPNIVNIDSERVGEIRILTGMRYSFFVANKADEPLFIYFNDSDESIENIRASRDSLGNLILRFSLDDLLDVENDLELDVLNVAEVVVVTEDEGEYVGPGEILIIDRKGY